MSAIDTTVRMGVVGAVIMGVTSGTKRLLGVGKKDAFTKASKASAGLAEEATATESNKSVLPTVAKNTVKAVAIGAVATAVTVSTAFMLVLSRK